LRKRNFSPTVITEVLTRFVEVGLLDDAVFAQEFTRYSLGKLRSRSVIATELRQRGVARQHIESALRDIDESAELEVAYQLARKRIRSLTGVNTATAYRRLSSALGRRGFSTQVISQVTRDVLGEMGQGLEN
jgi:regulatory protein